jgi:hypothetical protein
MEETMQHIVEVEKLEQQKSPSLNGQNGEAVNARSADKKDSDDEEEGEVEKDNADETRVDGETRSDLVEDVCPNSTFFP